MLVCLCGARLAGWLAGWLVCWLARLGSAGPLGALTKMERSVAPIWQDLVKLPGGMEFHTVASKVRLCGTTGLTDSDCSSGSNLPYYTSTYYMLHAVSRARARAGL